MSLSSVKLPSSTSRDPGPHLEKYCPMCPGQAVWKQEVHENAGRTQSGKKAVCLIHNSKGPEEGIDGCLEPEGERQREREREGEACRCFLGEEMGVFWSLGCSVFSMRWNITACNLVLSSPACILAQPPTPHGSFCLLWTVPLGGRKDADPETRALAWLSM